MAKKIAILISNAGTGTNLQGIIDAIENNQLDAQIVGVVSDKPDAMGLDRAKKHKLPVFINDKKEALFPLLQKLNPDYICLTGWKQFITKDVMDTFKILNLHPGLIPDSLNGVVKNPDGTDGLWNKGKFTEKALQNFFDKKATYAGSSIHFLTDEFDFGPVLGKTFEKIEADDTVESLYMRLKKKENQLYVDVLKNLCNRGPLE